MDTQNGRFARLWKRLPGRFRRGMLVALGVSLVGWSAAWSQPPLPTQTPTSPGGVLSTDSPERPHKDRLREGTELQEVHGYFRFVDERVAFFRSDGDARYIGLENLNLERIVSEITNNPTQLEWTVVGTITEYHGTNYLLVRRAILSRTSTEFASPRSPSSLN